MLIPLFWKSVKLCIHVDRVKNMFCDSYIVEFAYDPTCNYYEGGTYACRNCNNIKFPLCVENLEDLLVLPSYAS